MEAAAKGQMPRAAVVLSDSLRQQVDGVIRECCSFHDWPVIALNVRTNHVHLVLACDEQPRRALSILKARVTRVCREERWVGMTGSLWGRGGSARVVWDEEGVEAAVRYVKYGQ